MKVYDAEKNDGIDIQLNQAGSSTAFVTAQVLIKDVEEIDKNKINDWFQSDSMSIADLMTATDSVQTVEELLGKEQPDLALVVAILVSTGWNLNDDVFTPAEVWRARSSPLHKPMNDNHQADKILGHIVQTRPLDKSGNEIKIDENASPPAEFDIEVAGVLYKQFPELSDRIDEIIAKAKSGEMFVSMEAWFPDFGYGVVDPATGNTKLIERNEDTAFLTKHLRIYGGSGDYKGFKIGRVLKDIIFGAQGFVDEPANPDSVIKVAAGSVAASRIFVNAKLTELSEGGVEDMDEKQLKELQDQLDAARASLESKTAEVAELQKSAEEFRAKNYDGQIAELNTKVEELNASATEAFEKMVSIEAEKVELQKKLDEQTLRADKSEADLDEIRKTQTASDRMAKLSEIKTVEDAEATLAELRDMDDDTFEAVLKYAGEAKAEGSTDGNTATADDKTDDAETVLDNVKEDDTADLNASASTAETEKDGWDSVAAGLCGQDEKKEGGE